MKLSLPFSTQEKTSEDEMGQAKKELMRQDDLQRISIEIHRRVDNIEESTDGYLCDNGNSDKEAAFRLASALWRDNDGLVSCFNSREELMNAVDTCLDHLPYIADQNQAHFDRF